MGSHISFDRWQRRIGDKSIGEILVAFSGNIEGIPVKILLDASELASTLQLSIASSLFRSHFH